MSSGLTADRASTVRAEEPPTPAAIAPTTAALAPISVATRGVIPAAASAGEPTLFSPLTPTSRC